MRQLIMLFLTAFALSSATFAQDNAIDKYFDSYKSQDNFTTVSITGKMFELAGYIDVEDEDAEIQEFKDFITTINSFQLIAGRQVDDSRSKYTGARKKIDRSYEELMRVEDKKGDFSFFIDESRGIVRELVMAGTCENDLFIASLTGEMDLKQLSKLTSKITQGDFAHMGKLHEHGAAFVSVYPNPAIPGTEINVKVPEHLVGGTAIIYNMDGRQVKTERISNTTFQVSTRRMDAGNYIVRLTNDGVTIKQQFVLQSK